MESGGPELTIVVIALNEEGHIGSCLDALSRQSTSLAYEVLVVDDGSTDATSRIVGDKMARDPRIRLLRHEVNRGRGAARRAGQDSTDARLVAFVDADVIVPPNWVEACVTALPGRVAVSGIATPDGDCSVIWRLFQPPIRLRQHTSPISGGNVLFDGAALRLVPFSDVARLGEDFRLARQLVRHGFAVASVPDLVCDHRESKSYVQAARWMWQNGQDAASLPFEFLIVRVPDVTWLAWIYIVGVLLALTLGGAVTPAAATVGALVATAAVNVGFMASRFRVGRNPLRFVAATLANGPLITAYLAGRTVAFPFAAARASRVRTPPGLRVR
jgi:glycosyltransferase involved in cell wall biosynthesis